MGLAAAFPRGPCCWLGCATECELINAELTSRATANELIIAELRSELAAERAARLKAWLMLATTEAQATVTRARAPPASAAPRRSMAPRPAR